MKHAIFLALIGAARAQGPVRVVETHAGAGLYDLHGEAARRSSEAEGGIGRVMGAADLPKPVQALERAVRRANKDGSLRYYPGSPLLAVGAMTPGERYVGFELRPDDFGTLRALLAERTARSPSPVAQALNADGYAALAHELKGGELVLIDPPYERGDDYDQVAEAVRLCIAKKAAVAVWAPIKDLETLDALTRRIEAHQPSSLVVAEVRLRPLTNPLTMNGSAMLLVGAPEVDAAAGEVCGWVAALGGELGARGEVRRLIG